MNPAVFQPGGPGGEEEEEEEGSFHTRISHPHPTFSYLPGSCICRTWNTTWTYSALRFFRLLCFFFLHHTDWIDGIVSRWRSVENTIFGSLWLILKALCEKELWLRWMMDCIYLCSISIYLLPTCTSPTCTVYVPDIRTRNNLEKSNGPR